MNLNEVAIAHFKNDLKNEIIDALKPRFDSIDKKFLDVDKRFDGVDKRFEVVEKRFDDVDKQFEFANKRSDDVDKRFDNVDNNLERVAVQVLENGKSIDRINKKIDRYYEFEKDVLVHERILREHSERMSAIEKNMEIITCAFKKDEVSR